ncbi:MAG: hypothetical protein K1X67_06680 [Fimbriimonadaceae bacterium]|nr:hypothetical protein [Fimbriimonadaceae bacterium]
MPPVYATADIGSNTVHLLIAQVNGTGITRLRNDSEWLSLGEVVSREGFIPPDLERKLLSTLKSYSAAASALKAEGLYVFATEAMRVAKNHDEILARIRRQIGVEVDLISARREAELSIAGVQLDTSAPGPWALIEVGGGSAQVARCREDGVMTDEISLPLGTGRLIVEASLTQPSHEDQRRDLENFIRHQTAVCRDLDPVSRVVASGGVSRGLWRAVHPDGGRSLAVQELEYLQWASARINIETICRRFGVKAKRASTLLPGSTVFLELLRLFGQTSMTVSEFGVREGAIMEMARCRA